MIMTTEKDIRKFMQDNKIRIPKDDGFMEGLSRQLDLLATPEPFCSDNAEHISNDRLGVSDKIDCNEKLRQLLAVMDAFKKRNRKISIEIVITNLIICGLIVLLSAFAGSYSSVVPSSDSDFIGIVLKYRYTISSIVCSVFIVIYSYSVYQEFY